MNQESETFEQAFAKLNIDITDAFNRGDITTCASSYSENAILFVTDRPPIKGRRAIEIVLREYVDAGVKLVRVEPLKIKSNGDMGVCAGTYLFEISAEDGTPEQQFGKFVTVFMRQSDGAWKAVIDSLLPDAM